VETITEQVEEVAKSSIEAREDDVYATAVGIPETIRGETHLQTSQETSEQITLEDQTSSEDIDKHTFQQGHSPEGDAAGQESEKGVSDKAEGPADESSITVVGPAGIVRPSTPIRANGESHPAEPGSGRSLRSTSILLREETTPKGHDASVELAMTTVDSPSKSDHQFRDQSTALKLKLNRTLRTELSEFTSLKVLRYHLNQKLDVLAIATTTPSEPQRAKSGPRHYLVTFTITDPSIAPSGLTDVQVFRPYKEALPVLQAGDGILLRNFQVISVKGRGFALRSEQTEGSSYAVFLGDGGDDTEDKVDTRGPPVEYGVGERAHIKALKIWYNSLDPAAKAKMNRNTGNGNGSPQKENTPAKNKIAGKAFQKA